MNPPLNWLLLIHQLPPQPAYLRVKIGRRLAKVGAVALKNSVYVLPESDAALEDLQWIVREIAEDGGDASLFAARLLDGVTDEEVRELFRRARDGDYAEIAEAAQQAATTLQASGDSSLARRELSRLQRHLEEAAALDFFGAAARAGTETALLSLRGHLDDARRPAEETLAPNRLRGSTWVTRQGVQVDRIASAWLIRRFIDPEARFRFVNAQSYRPAPAELRFDMFEAEFTHEGDACTFEVLLRRLGPSDAALAAIGEVVHDIDLKDAKFARAEAAGIERLLAGVAIAHAEDEVRLERGTLLLDDLYAAFQRDQGRGH